MVAKKFCGFRLSNNALSVLETFEARGQNRTETIEKALMLESNDFNWLIFVGRVVANTSDINSELENINIYVNGNEFDNEQLFGVNKIEFFDNSKKLFDFNHNFSFNIFDLSRVNIEKASNYIIIDLNGQLQNDFNKTIYLNNNNFESICVKNSHINSISEISDSCDGIHEYNFTQCLTDGIYSTAGIDCSLNNGIIEVSNLRYSAILGVEASSTPSGGSSSCTPIWDCSDWEECVDGTQTRDCVLVNNCLSHFRPIKEQACEEITTDESKEEDKPTTPIIDEPTIIPPEEDEIVCPTIWKPVCGIDDETYSNECYATKKGIEIAYQGECKKIESIDTNLVDTQMDWTFILITILLLIIIITSVILIKKNSNKFFSFKK